LLRAVAWEIFSGGKLIATVVTPILQEKDQNIRCESITAHVVMPLLQSRHFFEQVKDLTTCECGHLLTRIDLGPKRFWCDYCDPGRIAELTGEHLGCDVCERDICLECERAWISSHKQDRKRKVLPTASPPAVSAAHRRSTRGKPPSAACCTAQLPTIRGVHGTETESLMLRAAPRRWWT
jgi:hypothetical protein